MSDYFDYIDERTKPKPAHRRPAPASDKLKEMGLNDRVTEIDKPSRDAMIVEEDTASTGILRALFGRR